MLLSFFLVSHSVSAEPYAYIPNVYDNNVTVFDTETFSIVPSSPIPVGTWPHGVSACPDGKKVYVSNWSEATVSVIDTATMTVVATIATGTGPIGVLPSIPPVLARMLRITEASLSPSSTQHRTPSLITSQCHPALTG